MTIYIVTSGEYSDYGIRAIFTDREKAALYCATHESKYEPPEIEEWETQDDTLDSSVQVNEKWILRYSLDGEPLGGVEKNYTTEKPGQAMVQQEKELWYRYKTLTVSIVLPMDAQTDKVKKIAQDAVAKWKYEHLVEGKSK